jgi:hypothetical protein
MIRTRHIPSLLAALSLAALAAPVAAEPPRFVSGAAARQQLTLTVYNDNLGLVREVRDVTLATGQVSLELQDVAASIRPETVHVRSLEAASDLRVLEQNYRYDLLSPQKLLEKYVGRRVVVQRWNEKEGRDERLEAEVLAVNEQPILKIGDEITFQIPGRLAFPEIPTDLIARPTLVWLLDARRERQRLEVSYLAGQMGWQADYVLVLDAADRRGDLTGWVTLTNESGAAYENARLKLVAGDVQQVRPPAPMEMRALGMMDAAEAAPAFREEGLFEYHLYTLERPVTLLDRETKQITLLEAPAVGVTKRLVLESQPHFFQGQWRAPKQEQKAAVFLDLENREENGLGRPLPRGVVRIYKADAEGAQQFVGEERIDHTPRDEKLELKTGLAFDVVGERRQTDFQVLGECRSETGWAIGVRNHKDEAVEVQVVEHAGGDWELVRQSQPAEKLDAQTFRFRVPVPARGAAQVDYRVRVKWC